MTSFFDEAGRRLVTAAVKDAERATSGEIVVVVRPSSATYRHVDFAVGLASAAAVLCVFLYHPAPFDFTWLPLELAGAFAVGVAVSLGAAPLKRALVSRAVVSRAVRAAACEAFVSRGVHRTRGRTGVLVLVSALERRVEIVADLAVKSPLDASALERAVRRHDVEAFAAAIVALGRALGETLPRAADDENELPDAPEEVA
jgi:putative membrane protein